jgi:hypothetical protein
LQLIADFSAFTLLLIPGMIYLFVRHDVQIYEIIAAVILLLVTIGLSSVLLLGFVAIRRMRTFTPNQRSLTEIWGVRFAVIMVALMGVVNVLSAVTPG